MKYTIIMNGCTERALHQMEELNYFVNNNILCEGQEIESRTIIFYKSPKIKDVLKSNIFTDRAIFVKVHEYQPEHILKLLKEICDTEVKDSQLYLFSGEKSGNELAVRFAYRKGGTSMVGADHISYENQVLTITKAVYSNYMQGEFCLKNGPFCISICKGKAAKCSLPAARVPEIKALDGLKSERENFIKKREWKKMEISTGLEEESFILIAGRGVNSKEKTEALKEITEELGAKLGVTRPVAMSAWADFEYLIGVSGAMTKPKLCITAGVSGAAAFYAGIEKSDYIISINSDEKAAIHKACDISIVDDYEAVLKSLSAIVKEDFKCNH